MNRKHGQSSRNQQSSSLNGRGMGSTRPAQTHSYDQDDEIQMGSRQSQGRNFSGQSSYDDSSYESNRAGLNSRARGTQGDYELSDRQSQSSDRFGYPSSMNSWRGNERSTGAGSRAGAGRMGQSNFNSWGAAHHDEDSQFGSQSEMGMGAEGQSSSWGASQGQYYGEGSLGNSYGSQSESQRGHFGKGPKGWKRSDDRIKEDVCETLARHSRIDASDIDVKVEDACVTLSGTVESKDIKRAAEMAIENLSGVDDVKNEIRVKKMGERGMDSSIHASSSGASTIGSSSTNSKSSKGTSHL